MEAMMAICLAAGLAAGASDDAKLERFEFTRTEMAVPIAIVLYASNDATADRAAQAAYERIHELNSILSDYDEDSELRRLCRTSSEGKPAHVSDDLWRVLDRALELSAQTGGAFDPTIGPVSKLWRRARRVKQLPSPEALKTALAKVDYRGIRLHEESQSVELLKSDMLLDLGGIAKGYALEEGAKVLKKQGIDRFLLHAGGDMVLGEAPPDKPGWKVGIGQTDPQKPPRFYLWLSNVETATSGDRFQYAEIAGRRYSHLIDPRTGLGLTGHCQTTVVVPRGTLADGLASAICILGLEKGLKLLEKTPGAAAYIISATEDGKEEIRQSENWKILPLVREELE
jgi:thiamine biosynthesis lipoprotein